MVRRDENVLAFDVSVNHLWRLGMHVVHCFADVEENPVLDGIVDLGGVSLDVLL